jgi:hypothetical protein
VTCAPVLVMPEQCYITVRYRRSDGARTRRVHPFRLVLAENPVPEVKRRDDTRGRHRRRRQKIPDAVRIEIDGFGRERFVRCRVGQSHVRSVGVVVGFIVAQDAA